MRKIPTIFIRDPRLVTVVLLVPIAIMAMIAADWWRDR